MALNSLEISFSIRNLPSLRVFHLSVHRIDENITHIFDQMQYIEELSLHANLNYFNLDNLVNLSRLCIGGNLCNDFNFELFKNLSKQLEQLTFFFYKIDYEIFVKMLNGHNFLNLLTLNIDGCNMRRIEKKFIDQFPNLVKFTVTNCSIETIEDNAFSNLKDLYLIDLSDNLLERIYKRCFSGSRQKKVILLQNDIKFIEDGLKFTDNPECFNIK